MSIDDLLTNPLWDLTAHGRDGYGYPCECHQCVQTVEILTERDTLRAALREALDWAAPARPHVMPPDSACEMQTTMTRIAGRDRAERLAALRKMVE